MRPSQIIASDPKFTETRKVSLYSNFERLKDTNEYGYDANISAWRGALLKCVSSHCFDNKTALDTTNLLSELADTKNGSPMALNAVIDDMVARRELIPLHNWLSSKRPLLRTEWSVGAAVNSIGSWAWSKVFPSRWSSGSSGKLKTMQYVCVEVIDPIATKLHKQLEKQSKQNGGTITSKIFLAEELETTKTDIQVCVAYLNRERQIPISYDEENNFIVLSSTVSEEHQTVADIRRNMHTLSARTELLQQKVADLDGQARNAVKSKQTAVAKQRLRSKAGVEKALSQTLGLYSQLETVISNVDMASDQSIAVDVLEKSARLLKNVNRTVGSSDRVTQVMDAVQDGIADTEEMSSELARLSLSDSFDAEVEDELEQLEAEAASNKLDKLNAPAHAPSDATTEIADDHAENSTTSNAAEPLSN